MKNASTFSNERVTRRHRADAEFLALAEQLGIDSGAMVHPGTELIFAMARRDCGKCTSKEKCRQALDRRPVRLSQIAPFCPNAEVIVDLLRRQL
jgi:Family of unknown function (DUF6455)